MAKIVIILSLLAPYLVAFIASVCYAILFNAPRSLLMYSGLCGAAGWLGVVLLSDHVIARAFLGAIIVGLLSVVFSRIKKHPRTLFAVAGIVPLVPGATAYQSMLAFVEKQYTLGATLAFETFLSALAIAAGLILASFLIPRRTS